jgi:hypothetical protein
VRGIAGANVIANQAKARPEMHFETAIVANEIPRGKQPA